MKNKLLTLTMNIILLIVLLIPLAFAADNHLVEQEIKQNIQQLGRFAKIDKIEYEHKSEAIEKIALYEISGQAIIGGPVLEERAADLCTSKTDCPAENICQNGVCCVENDGLTIINNVNENIIEYEPGSYGIRPQNSFVVAYETQTIYIVPSTGSTTSVALYNINQITGATLSPPGTLAHLNNTVVIFFDNFESARAYIDGGALCTIVYPEEVFARMPNFKSNEIIVKFKSDVGMKTNKGPIGLFNKVILRQPMVATDIPSLNSLNKRFSATDQRELLTQVKKRTKNTENKYLLTIETNETIGTVLESYCSDPNVEYCDYNYIYATAATPNDTNYSSQWAHQNINSEPAWDIETGSEDTVIAVIDSGVDYSHIDLILNIWRNPNEDCDTATDLDANNYFGDCLGYDFVNIDLAIFDNITTRSVSGEDYTAKDNDPDDFYGHGTHVAGIAAAVANNNLGIAGTCWNCTIMPLRAFYAVELNENESWISAAISDSITIEEAVYYARDNNANIISMSFGQPSNDTTIYNALKDAANDGIVLIAAAGNADSNDTFYPAGLDFVIGVAAINQTNQKASFSSYGDWINVSAPGSSILSTVPPSGGILSDSSGYRYLSGTSMSTPFVSGLAGLVLSANPTLSKQEVEQLIIANTQNIDAINPSYAGLLGTGLINTTASLNNVPPYPQNTLTLTNVEDTHTNLNSNNYAGSDDINIWSWSDPPHKPANTLIMKWNLTGIPNTTNIIDARLELYQTISQGGDYETSIHPIVGVDPVINEVTGYNYDALNQWTPVAPGTTWNDAPLGLNDTGVANDIVVLNTADGWKTWNVTTMVKGWIGDFLPNYGLLIRPTVGTPSETGRSFSSSENANLTLRPRLVIIYSGEKICIDNDLDSYDTCDPGDTGDDGAPADCNDLASGQYTYPANTNSFCDCNLTGDGYDGNSSIAAEVCGNGIDEDCDGNDAICIADIEPICDPSNTTHYDPNVFWCIDFEICPFGSPSTCDPKMNSGNAYTTIIDAAVGTKAVQATYAPGGSGPSSETFFPIQTDTLSMRYYVKFKDGYLQSAWYSGNHGPSMDFGCGGNVGMTGDFHDQGYTLVMEGGGNCPYAPISWGIPGANFEFENNLWYEIEYQTKLDDFCSNTVVTPYQGCNGEVRLFIDGQLKTEVTGLNLRGADTTKKFYKAWPMRSYYGMGPPEWGGTILFDNFIFSNQTGCLDANGSQIPCIGSALNENQRGTPDSDSPYPNYGSYNSWSGHKENSDCTGGPFDGHIGSGISLPWRDTAADITSSSKSILQSAITNNQYIDNCFGNDTALLINLSSSNDGAGAAYSGAGLTPGKTRVIHGWIYPPNGSVNDYSQNPKLAGFVQSLSSYSTYLALTIDSGKWAVRDSSGTYPSTQDVLFDTWHEFELVSFPDNTYTLMIDKSVVIPRTFLSGSFSSNTAAVVGVIDYQGTGPFKMYYDDTDVGSASYWTCGPDSGWNAASCPHSTTPTTLLTDIISYYLFDIDASDAHNGNNGVINGVTQTTGKLGNAYLFDGFIDYIEVARLNNFEETYLDFSLSMWVKLNDDGNNHALIAEEQSVSNKEWLTEIKSTGELKFSYIEAGGAYYIRTTTSAPINFGTWHHVVFTIDRTNNIVKAYVDNVEQSFDDNSIHVDAWGVGPGYSAPFWIGKSRNSVANGIIDEVGIWNKALTASEVSELYNSGNGFAYPFGGVPPTCTDADSDTYAIEGGSCGQIDCNDDPATGAGINPGAAEICGNGIDEDCSGADLACVENVEDICPGSSSPRSDVFWCESFEHDFGQQFGFGPGTIETGDAAVGIGAYVGRFTPGGTDGFYATTNFPQQTDTISFRYYFKYKDGLLQPTGHGTGPIQCSAGITNEMSTFPYLLLNSCNGFDSSSNFYVNVPNTVLPLKNNKWYILEQEAILDTSCTDIFIPTGCNGVFRMWIDNQLIMEHTNVNYRGANPSTKFFAYWGPRSYYHPKAPNWDQKMLHDNYVASTQVGCTDGGNPIPCIGAATNENFINYDNANIDPTSPYINVESYNGWQGYKMASDCFTTGSSFDGYGYWSKPWRDISPPYPQFIYIGGVPENSWESGTGANPNAVPSTKSVVQSAIAHNLYQSRCFTSNPETALRVTIPSTNDGGGTYHDIEQYKKIFSTAGVKPLVFHGWVYLPSDNDYTNSPALVGVVQNTYFDHYATLTVKDGNWAIKQRYNKGTPQFITTTKPVNFNSWTEFELIVYADMPQQTISLMIGDDFGNREIVVSRQNLPLNAQWWNPAAPPSGWGWGTTPQGVFVIGVTDFQGIAPFTVYYDDTDLGSASYWTCDLPNYDSGWNAASCPHIITTCGDGAIEGSEQCETNPLDLNGQTCQTLGYDSGTLNCDVTTCQFDTSACTTTAPSPPIYTKFSGSTTNFSAVDFTNLQNAILEIVTYGKIEFGPEIIDFTSLNLDSYVFIENNLIGIDETNLPNLANQNATLTLYGLPFANPKIMENGADCTHCSITSYNGGNLTFTVDHFSNFTAVEATNQPPTISNILPVNGTTINESFAVLQANMSDPEGDNLTVSVYGADSAAERDDEKNALLYRVENVTSPLMLSYNWSAPVTAPDANTLMLQHFDTNGIFDDASGNNNNGSCTNCPTFLENNGKFAGAYNFDEINDIVVVPDISGSFNELTISFWFKDTSTAGTLYEYFFSWGNISLEVLEDNSIHVYFVEDTNLYNNTLRTWVDDMNDSSHVIDVTGAGSLIDGNWHLYTLVKDSTGADVYIDGALAADGGLYGSGTIDPFTDIHIGGRFDLNVDRFFGGDIDEVAIWNMALTAQEIRDLFELGNRTFFWKLKADDGADVSEVFATFNLSGPVCPDADSDGFTDAVCGGIDCNDNDPLINPGAAEICTDSIDNDCDGLVDSVDSDCAIPPVSPPFETVYIDFDDSTLQTAPGFVSFTPATYSPLLGYGYSWRPMGTGTENLGTCATDPEGCDRHLSWGPSIFEVNLSTGVYNLTVNGWSSGGIYLNIDLTGQQLSEIGCIDYNTCDYSQLNNFQTVGSSPKQFNWSGKRLSNLLFADASAGGAWRVHAVKYDRIGDLQTCSEQGGDLCVETEICSGSLLDASDPITGEYVNNCCNVACTPAPVCNNWEAIPALGCSCGGTVYTSGACCNGVYKEINFCILEEHPKLFINKQDIPELKCRAGKAGFEIYCPNPGIYSQEYNYIKYLADSYIGTPNNIYLLYNIAFTHLIESSSPDISTAYSEEIKNILLSKIRIDGSGIEYIELGEGVELAAAMDWTIGAIQEPDKSRILDALVTDYAGGSTLGGGETLNAYLIVHGWPWFSWPFVDNMVALSAYGHYAEGTPKYNKIKNVLERGKYYYFDNVIPTLLRNKGPVGHSPHYQLYEDDKELIMVPEVWGPAQNKSDEFWQLLSSTQGLVPDTYFYQRTGYPGLEGRMFQRDSAGAYPDAPHPEVPATIAKRTGNPIAQWYANRAYQIISDPAQRLWNYGYEFWRKITYVDETIPVVDTSTINKSIAFDGGLIAIRQGWNTEDGVIMFEYGQPVWDTHQHFDAGQIQINKKGHLVTASGDYSVYQTRPFLAGANNWGHDDYYHATISHSTLTIYDPDEQQYFFESLRPNAGDQRWVSGFFVPINRDPKGTERDYGELSAFEYGPNGAYTYAFANITHAYAPIPNEADKATAVYRKLVFMDPYLLVLDNVDSTNQNFIKTSHLHFNNRPGIDYQDLQSSDQIRSLEYNGTVDFATSNSIIDRYRHEYEGYFAGDIIEITNGVDTQTRTIITNQQTLEIVPAETLGIGDGVTNYFYLSRYPAIDRDEAIMNPEIKIGSTALNCEYNCLLFDGYIYNRTMPAPGPGQGVTIEEYTWIKREIIVDTPFSPVPDNTYNYKIYHQASGNGNWNPNSGGIWEYSGSKILSAEDTDGKMFVKPLLPQSPVVRIVGGPKTPSNRINDSEDGYGSSQYANMLYYGGNRETFEFWNKPGSVSGGKNQFYIYGNGAIASGGQEKTSGWGRLEVEPSSQQIHDNFLNVIELSDLSKQTMDSAQLYTGTNNVAAAVVNNSKALIFSTSLNEITSTDIALPTNTILETLIIDLIPDTGYTITLNDNVLSISVGSNMIASSQGTIYTQLNTGSGTLPVCGNGIIELGEECDDNNTISGDGCSDTCTLPVISIQNLISHWKLDGNADDSHIFGNNLTNNGASFTSGIINQSADLNGSAYLSKVDPTSMPGDLANQGLTVSAWIRPTLIDNSKAILYFGSGTTEPGNFTGWYMYLERVNDSYYQVGAATAQRGTTTNSWPISEWRHVVMTRPAGGASTIKIYVDGVENASFGTNPYPTSPGDQFAIGRYIAYIWFQNFIGEIDEVTVWSRALSSQEIMDLYNNGAGREYPFGSTGSCLDNDSDGYGIEGSDPLICTYPDTDCNDNDSLINPGATEICDDGLDNDCNSFCDQVSSTCSDGSTPGDVACGLIGIVEDICPQGANPDPNVIWCNGFHETLSGDAAVGEGSFVGTYQPGGTSGFDQSETFTSVENISIRYYIKFKNGFLQNHWGHHVTGLFYDCESGVTYDILASSLPHWHYGCTGVQERQFGGIPFSFKNNKWYLIEQQYIMDNNCPDNCDGVARTWIDGTLIQNIENTGIREGTNKKFTGTWGPRSYYTMGGPVWNQQFLYDNFVASTKVNCRDVNNNLIPCIGSAKNQNPLGTADPDSPYVNYETHNPWLGHKPSSDCTSPFTSGSNGMTPTNVLWRDSAEIVGNPPSFVSTSRTESIKTMFQESITNGVYTDNCGLSSVDTALIINLESSNNGGGVGYSIESTLKPVVIHGYIYLPSSNDYGVPPTLTGISTSEYTRNNIGIHEVALTVNNNNWAIKQRYDGSTPQFITSTTSVSYDTWNEFELILYPDMPNQTASLMINKNIAIPKITLPLNAQWWNPNGTTSSPPGWGFGTNMQATIVIGVIDFQGTAPFTVYYDDTDLGTVSYWTCDITSPVPYDSGWNAASCPHIITTCGDGAIEGSEQCETNPLDLNGQTCQTLGYDSGTLNCDVTTCQFDTSACTTIAPPLCSLTNAYWADSGNNTITNITENDQVYLIVDGANCDGEQIGFEVFEDDVVGDDNVTLNPSPAIFNGGRAIATWTAEWQDDCAGACNPPEYYFHATLISNNSITIVSAGLLEVVQFSQQNESINITNITPPDLVNLNETQAQLKADITHATNANINVTVYGANNQPQFSSPENSLLFRILNAPTPYQLNYTWNAPVHGPNENLGALFHFDMDNDWTDYSGKNNSLSCTSCPAFNATGGRFAGSYHFNGSQVISKTNVTGINLPSGYTVAAWIKPEPGSGIDEIIRYGQASDKGFVLGVDHPSNSSYFRFGFAGFDSDTQMTFWDSEVIQHPVNEWHLVVARASNTVTDTWVNGVKENELWVPRGQPNENHSLIIGSSSSFIGWGTYSGSVDEVVIWDRALSDAEIRNLYRLQNTSWNWKIEVTDGFEITQENQTFVIGQGAVCVDNDGDGFESASCGGTDCNDNDASIGNNYTRQCGTDIGICSVGTETCIDAVWSPCTGSFPEPEICNAVDDDCDGRVDCIANCTTPAVLTTNRYVNFVNTNPFVLDIPRYGKITFKENITFTCGADLDYLTNISQGKIMINSIDIPELNKSATIELYNLSFVNPYILKDGNACPDTICNITNYTNGTLTFDVTHFTIYEVAESPFCGDGSCNGDETTETCPSDCPPPEERTSGGGGGGGGLRGTDIFCIESWSCSDWSECTPQQSKTRICTDVNNCGTTFLKPAESRWCYYPSEENITQIEETIEEILLSPQPEPLLSIRAEQISEKEIIVYFDINNEHEDVDLEAAAIELNINKGRRTHYIDYLDNLEIKAKGRLSIKRQYSTRYLISDIYDVKAVLFGRGFKKAEASTTLELTKNSTENKITGEVVLNSDSELKPINALLLILILLLGIQILMYKKKEVN